jgi:hypothetical protein
MLIKVKKTEGRRAAEKGAETRTGQDFDPTTRWNTLGFIKLQLRLGLPTVPGFTGVTGSVNGMPSRPVEPLTDKICGTGMGRQNSHQLPR